MINKKLIYGGIFVILLLLFSSFFTALSTYYITRSATSRDSAMSIGKDYQGKTIGSYYYSNCRIKEHLIESFDNNNQLISSKSLFDVYCDREKVSQDTSSSNTNINTNTNTANQPTTFLKYSNINLDVDYSNNIVILKGSAEVLNDKTMMLEVSYSDFSWINSLTTYSVKSSSSSCDSNEYFPSSVVRAYKKGDIINFEFTLPMPYDKGEYQLKLMGVNSCNKVGQEYYDVFRVPFYFSPQINEDSGSKDSSLDQEESGNDSNLIDYEENQQEVEEHIPLSNTADYILLFTIGASLLFIAYKFFKG